MTASAANNPPSVTIEVVDPEAMDRLGRRLSAILRAGDLLMLVGPLGAGKTTLVRGLAAGLQVKGAVSSPTFVIARRHAPAVDGRPALVHVDAYRVAHPEELDDLELDLDLADAILAVEWGQGKVESWAHSRLEVTIVRDALPDEVDTDTRMVTVSGIGPRWADVDLTEVLT